jgi:primosomal protein N' (replication factor Y) (superfamily II helicase)
MEMIARVEPLTLTRAVRGPFDYRLGPDQPEIAVGSLVRVPFGRSRPLGVVVELVDRSELPIDRLAEPEEVLPASVPADLVSLAMWMADEYCSTPARALGLVLAPGARKGSTSRKNRGPRRAAKSYRIGSAPVAPPPLTDAQQAALEPILAAARDRRMEKFLLHGVTGSGKTEVYLRAVSEVLAQGRGAIVLVPEIAMTPQALGRFTARFPDKIAVLHSALTDAARREEWLRLARGDALVCVGPRSAVFAPVKEIGLIVVDEEHEASYKHEGDPRYDARSVAARRAQGHGAVLVLGSATPRPESFHQVRRLRLPERIDLRPLPPVELLDMRGLHHPLHPHTRAALAELRRAGGKAIILLNRRGWSNFLSCRSCGRVWMCPNCEVALVLHRGNGAPGFVACHHCGHSERSPTACGACGSSTVARHGAGTERIEHELREAIGDRDFPVLRLDADAAGLDGRASALEEFADARAGLLIGTQMVAKGHDFADVTLGIVLDADQTLRFPDLRAEERTFSLITQLAGRAGRGEGSSRVLVQTLAPEARSIAFAAGHDAEGFLSGELERRKMLRYPPFSSLIRIVFSAPDASDAKRAAVALRERIAPPQAEVLGPAALFALRGRARSQVVVKAGARAAAIAEVGEAVQSLARERRGPAASISVDVDPV